MADDINHSAAGNNPDVEAVRPTPEEIQAVGEQVGPMPRNAQERAKWLDNLVNIATLRVLTDVGITDVWQGAKDAVSNTSQDGWKKQKERALTALSVLSGPILSGIVSGIESLHKTSDNEEIDKDERNTAIITGLIISAVLVTARFTHTSVQAKNRRQANEASQAGTQLIPPAQHETPTEPQQTAQAPTPPVVPGSSRDENPAQTTPASGKGKRVVRQQSQEGLKPEGSLQRPAAKKRSYTEDNIIVTKPRESTSSHGENKSNTEIEQERKKHKILVIEDEVVKKQIYDTKIPKYWSDATYESTTSMDKAMSMFAEARKTDKPFTFVLIDNSILNQPGAELDQLKSDNGLAGIKRMREIEAQDDKPKTTIVMNSDDYTKIGQENLKKRAEEAGADSFVEEKITSPKLIMSQLHHYLGELQLAPRQPGPGSGLTRRNTGL